MTLGKSGTDKNGTGKNGTSNNNTSNKCTNGKVEKNSTLKVNFPKPQTQMLINNLQLHLSVNLELSLLVSYSHCITL